MLGLLENCINFKCSVLRSWWNVLKCFSVSCVLICFLVCIYNYFCVLVLIQFAFNYCIIATPDEDNLECLCKLLATVGQKLDNSLAETEAKFKSVPIEQRPKFLPEEKCMDKFFDRLDKLSGDKKISSRIRFAIMVSIRNSLRHFILLCFMALESEFVILISSTCVVV